MDYLKFTASQIFDGYRMLGPGHVLIARRDGTIEEITATANAGDDVQLVDGIISPGFINCHCHLELSHMKGLIPKGIGLITFITAVMQSRASGNEVILEAIQQGEEEMLQNGIVATGDICNTSFTIGQKKRGRIRYHNFIEALGFHPQTAHQRFVAARNVFDLFAVEFPGQNSIVPHAPYSVAPNLFDEILHHPGNQLISLHNQECPDENQLYINKSGGFPDFYQTLGMELGFFTATGKSSLQSVLPHFMRNQRVLLVHNVFTDKNDVAAVERYTSDHGAHFHFCLCPNANLYISGKLPDLSMHLTCSKNIVLGTDSLASNDGLSILGEMKTISNHFPFIPVEELFCWATLNGARALQMDKLLGSFEKGKTPGVICSAADLSSATRLL